MNLIENIQTNFPITNIPDLLQLHHNNPLQIGLLWQLIAIFAVVAIMSFVNHGIRYKGKSNLYPVLYTLLGISLVFIYYYCFQIFQGEDTAVYFQEMKQWRNPIGWFCYHKLVGWGWAIVGIACLAYVAYNLLSAVMQTVAQLSVEAKMSGEKPWKEWKWVMGVALAGVVISGAIYFADHVASSWALVICQAILIVCVLGKVIADCRRCKNPLWGILIGIVFYIGIIAVVILTAECLHGALAIFAAILIWLSSAKARKKEPKQKSK